MKNIIDLRISESAGVKKKIVKKNRRGEQVVEIRDPKTKQAIRIWSNDDIDAFLLDSEQANNRDEGEKTPDAVIVGQTGSISFVIFIELTHSIKPRKSQKNPEQRKLNQLYAGITHFHPFGNKKDSSHGNEHYARWSSGEDLPEIPIDSHHKVGGIGIGFQAQARIKPHKDDLEKKKATRVIWSPVRSSHNQADITLSEIFRNLGWKFE